MTRLPAALAGALCVGWLALTTGYGAAAAPGSGIDLGGHALPGGGDGSTDAKNPTTVPPGLWRTTVDGAFPQYFSYQRQIRDSVVHVGVIGAPTGTDGDSVRISTGVRGADGATSADLTDCGSADDSTDYATPHQLVGAEVAVGEEEGSTGDQCRSADTVQVVLDRGYSTRTSALPVVLKVVEEAPVSDPGGTTADEEPTYQLPEPGSPRELDGATSFDDAPELDARSGPVTVKASIREGTEVLWRVPLRWSDQLVARVDVPKATGADAKTFEYGGASLDLNLVDPVRGRFGTADTARDHQTSGEYRADEVGLLVATGVPVRTANGTVPGDHWVALAAERPEEGRDPVEVPVELTVAVVASGSPAPRHQDAVLAQDGGAGPKGYSARKPFLVAEDTFSAVASGNPVVVEDGDGWLTGRRWAGLGLGAASLACLVGGAARLRSAR